MSRTRAKQGNRRKFYEVTLYFTQTSRARQVIKARSLAEAERKAEEISAEDLDDLDPIDGDLMVDSVELLEEGKSHE